MTSTPASFPTRASPPLARAMTTSRDAQSAPDARGRERSDESAELYRLLVASVRDYAIFALDARGYVLTWNVGAEQLKGYHAHEIIGRHFSTFYPREDVDDGKPEMELRVAARDGRFEDEGWRLRKDGTRFWANVDHHGAARRARRGDRIREGDARPHRAAGDGAAGRAARRRVGGARSRGSAHARARPAQPDAAGTGAGARGADGGGAVADGGSRADQHPARGGADTGGSRPRLRRKLRALHARDPREHRRSVRGAGRGVAIPLHQREGGGGPRCRAALDGRPHRQGRVGGRIPRSSARRSSARCGARRRRGSRSRSKRAARTGISGRCCTAIRCPTADSRRSGRTSRSESGRRRPRGISPARARC